MKAFALIFEDEYRETTNHTSYESVIDLYLNELVRTSQGLKRCVRVIHPKEAELEHRLQMVNDDLNALERFIDSQSYDFTKPTEQCEKARTHIDNIRIACDLTEDESLNWKLFNK